jgi:cytosine/adenosine deaminase-related metal-dependent hydrolase
MQFEAEGTNEAGYVDGLIPDIAADLAWGALESKAKVEEEIDLMLRTVRSFWELEPDQVAKLIQAMSARCTELCVHLHRLEGRREWKQVRTQQVERLLTELDRQWKLASRLIEVRRQDIELAR